MDPFFKTFIVDDEPFNTEILKKLLVPYKNMEIAGTATTVETALLQIMTLRPDLLFLDIELHDKNGLDWYKEIKDKIDWSMLVVIVSSHIKYGVKACLPFVFSFLVKPVNAPNVSVVMSDFFKIKEKEAEQLFKNNCMADEHERFILSTVKGDVAICLNEIGFFEIIHNNNHWNVILMNKKSLRLKCCIKTEDILLYSRSFIQINRNQIINRNYFEGKNNDGLVWLKPPFSNINHLRYSRFFKNNIEKRFKKL